MDAVQKTYDVPKFKEQYENFIGGEIRELKGESKGNSGNSWARESEVGESAGYTPMGLRPLSGSLESEVRGRKGIYRGDG